ncbi:MAG: catalase family protein [Chloroflexota bacterium]
MDLRRVLNDAIVGVIHAERRVEPYYRDTFDRVFQRPLTALAQRLINARREDERLGLCEERLLPNEWQVTEAIIAQMAAFLRAHYTPGTAERAGNTKTYGVVRGEFEVRGDVPLPLRQGIFARPATYRAWVRFAGPGPLAPPDMDDNGILSIGVKVMGVEGPKLIDDEAMTQDFTGISAPTFTTPDIVENLKLQKELGKGRPIWYFINPSDSHLLDALMQGLYARTQSSPLEARYWSCVPYLLGGGQAMHYALKPRSGKRSAIPHSPSANYLRDAMVRTLGTGGVSFDFMIQLQTDAYRMPIENAAVEWPESLSPFVRVATLRLPAQRFDSPAQLRFARNLSFNPWHSIAAHRPLGNQNRARKELYLALSRLRQAMNAEPHIEPTGDEVFDAGGDGAGS